MLTSGSADDDDVAALIAVGPRLGRIDLRSIDGEPAAAHPLAGRLRAAGFVPSTHGLVIYPARSARVEARADA
jgi:hypothetical protein